MKRLILAALVSACGAPQESETASDVTRLTVEPVGCTFESCVVTVGGNGDGAFVVSFALGQPPAACDSQSIGTRGAATIVRIERLARDTLYGFRGCIFNGGEYSDGATMLYTTGHQ